MSLWRLSLCVLLSCLLLAPRVYADEAAVRDGWIDWARGELGGIEQRLDSLGDSVQAQRWLPGFKDILLPVRTAARDCAIKVQENIGTLTVRITALGEPSADETPDVAASRRDLDKQLQLANRQRADCEQIAQLGKELFDRVLAIEKALLTSRLLTREPATWEVVPAAITDPVAWSRLVTGLLSAGSGWDRLSLQERAGVVALLVVLFFTGLGLRHYSKTRSMHSVHMRSVITVLPWLLPAGGVFLLLTVLLPEWPPALIASMALAMVVWLTAGIIIDTWLTGRMAKGMSERDAKLLGRWVRILAALLSMGGLLLSANVVIGLPDPHYLLLRTASLWLLVVGLAWSALILRRVPGLAGTRGVRILMVLAAIMIALAETAGYRNLSVFLLAGLGGTAAGLLAAKEASLLLTHLYDGLDEGTYAWQRTFRQYVGLAAEERVPGLIWFRLVSALVIWAAFLLWALWVWGLSDQGVGLVLDQITGGFDIGSLHFAPAKLVGAIAVLAIGMSLSRWMRIKVVPDLVRRSRLDRGGREAITTISGYIGVMVTLLIALGVAGINFAHLALVAGALSVGIGFGLQNVVNNFVSGLILLFERPVRTGDWIVVGDVQGFVRKISIRSTQIETFDRADVIVPNSDLISNRVSNLMLNDPWGRITVPVGVAYGSDVKQVMEILLAIAGEHPGVLKNQPGVSPPKAFFTEFGDSALLFELRCFIRQIDRKFEIKSDLNVAIDAAFRKAGISIPFPQRDVHLFTAQGQGSDGQADV
ncbi:MAG TPA: mechanosensitive ion channel domain-containing protein [Gammaproteobacteria bacterium]|nr:mechanosensitive ion channel domain-containing protein [Gammaproteobacteria bacterium]